MLIHHFQTELRDEELVLLTAEKSYEDWRNIDECCRTFHIYDHEVRKALDKYFLLHWSTEYFLEQLANPESGFLIKDGIRYYVMYQELLDNEYVKQYSDLRLSFRKLSSLPFGFVLVRSLRKKIPVFPQVITKTPPGGEK